MKGLVCLIQQEKMRKKVFLILLVRSMNGDELQKRRMMQNQTDVNCHTGNEERASTLQTSRVQDEASKFHVPQ